jgi:hypothetical protein
VTTEYNLNSANQPSGLHPIPAPGTGPIEPIIVPDTFFINANLFAGGGIPGYLGLGMPEARGFQGLLTLSPVEYQSLVQRSATRLDTLAGDANFAWLVPEPSHVDNSLIDVLVKRGVITREFAAAVLAVDLERPVFSDRRAELLSLIPVRYSFKLVDAGQALPSHPDALTQIVVSQLRAANPAPESAQGQLLTLLDQPNPISAVKARVVAYLERVRGRLTNAGTRQAEIDCSYRIAIVQRQLAAQRIPTLIESSKLLPLAQLPAAIPPCGS